MGKKVEGQPQSGKNDWVLDLAEIAAEINEGQASLVVGPEQPQLGNNEWVLDLAEIAAEIEEQAT
jgi:hypothetical protein